MKYKLLCNYYTKRTIFLFSHYHEEKRKTNTSNIKIFDKQKKLMDTARKA